MSGTVRPSTLPVGVARVEQDVIDADDSRNQRGAAVPISFEEQGCEANWRDRELGRQGEQTAVLTEQDLAQAHHTRHTDSENALSHAFVPLLAGVGQVERRPETKVLKRHQHRDAGERATRERTEHANRSSASERPRMNDGEPSQQSGWHGSGELRNGCPSGAESNNRSEPAVGRFIGAADAHGRAEREHEARGRECVTDEERGERPDWRRQTE